MPIPWSWSTESPVVERVSRRRHVLDVASLHGIADLRITKPELPWPEPDHLVELALTAVRAAAREPRQSR